MENETTYYGFRAYPEDMEKMKKIAKSEERTLAQCIRVAIKKYIQENPNVEIKEDVSNVPVKRGTYYKEGVIYYKDDHTKAPPGVPGPSMPKGNPA